MNNKINFVPLGVMLCLLVVTVIGRQALLGSTNVKLAAAPAYTGVVAQALYAGSTKGTMPAGGKDFTLKGLHEFDNDTWLAATVNPLNNSFNSSIVVLEKQHGTFSVVLGPGSSFPSDYIISLPADVAAYLSSQGVFYDAVSSN